MNSYAISTSDLADSLTRSSASLVAANNTLEQSVALTTAANTTIQNPEVVGTTLKTLAMRIRGVKTELEEAGEDTEGMITNTAKLQEKVQALTNVDGFGGVNILANSNEFKSTYDILLEISRVWDKMNDVDQAALLEIIAGKRAGSAVASILANGDILERAYNDALNADGSAQSELDTYLDSIQGKMDQLSNSTQTMWMNFMNSDVLKFFISLANIAVQLADNIGLVQVALAAFTAKTAFGAESFGQFFKLDINDETKKIDSFGFSLQGAWKNAEGLGLGAKAAAIGTQLLNAATSAFISLGVSAVIGLIIKGLDELIHKQERTAEAAEEALNAYKNTQETLNRQKATISELAASYDRLSKGVNLDTNENINLSTDAYQNYLDVCNDIADMYPHLVTGFDAQGNAILSLKGNVDLLTQAYKEAAAENRRAVIKESDSIFDTFKNTYGYSGFASATPGLEAKLAMAEQVLQVISQGDKAIEEWYLKQYPNAYSQSPTFEAVLAEAGIDKSQIETFVPFIGRTAKADGFKQASDKLIAFVKSTRTKIDVETNKVQTLMSAYLEENLQYATLGKEAQSNISRIISGLNADFISGFENADDLWVWVKTNIVDQFADPKIGQAISDNMSFAFDLQSAFQGDGIDLETYKENILSFVDFIRTSGLDETVQKQILQMFDIDFDRLKNGEMSIGKDIDQMIVYVQGIVDESTKDKILQLNYSDLKIINNDAFKVPVGTILSWDELQAKIKETKAAMTEDFTVNNFADYAESISAVQSNISTLQEALEKLEGGTFTFTDFMDLIAEYPELADGVDTASKSFNGLSKNLRKAIRNSPDDLVDELKDLRDRLKEAGKSTGAIDQLITSIENLPIDAVKSLGEEYITLADQIDEAKQAQNELKEAMEENPNEGYETRGDAIEQMKTLMEEGRFGSESELWSIAEAFGFTYDSAKTINENADALHAFIKAREAWYKTDDDGNYTYEGTESFINDVEKVVANNEKLQSWGVKWEYENGALNFDFNNSDWDDIVKILSESKELAGLTSEEFYDLLMQVGQFFDINWQDADDLNFYLDQITVGSKSASESFDAAKNAVGSFLESEGISLDWLEGNIDNEKFKALPEDIQNLLTKYYELKEKVEEDPLGINWQLKHDSRKNKTNGLTDESLEAINKLVSTATDAKTGVTWLSFEDLAREAKEAGMNMDELGEHMRELQKAGKVIDLKVTAEDPLGLVSMQHEAETTISYLNALGLTAQSLDGAFTIDLPKFVDMMVAAGWGSDQIASYISSLNSQGYTFTYTTEENKVETLNVNTEEGQAKVDELVASSNEMTDTETLTVNLNGTAEGALKTMQSTLSQLTGTSHTVTVNETTNKHTNYTWSWGKKKEVDVNGTAHVHGTAYKSGSWGAPKTTDALVGELGPELRVRGNEWTLIGEHGAEFTDVRKGDIIFNHKQTEDLLANGYVTGRGKAYAEGTAYVSGSGQRYNYTYSDTDRDRYLYDGKYTNKNGEEIKGAASKLSQAAKDISDSSEEFREVFDWIEVRLEEINEDIDLKSAKLENAVGYSKQNSIIVDMIKLNEKLYDNLIAGSKKYYTYANKLLAKIPVEYRKAAQDGSIAIESFVGEVDEKTLNAIEDYREWVQKGADATQQAEEVLTEISSLAKQAIDNIAADYENKTSLRDSKIEQYEAYNALLETDVGYESEKIYQAMIKETNKNIKTITEQRNKMQAELNKRVEFGQIKKYSQDWYDAVNDISALDTQIIELKTDTEDWQDTINELHWDKLDDLMSRLEAVSDEAENLIDILGNKDAVDEAGNWTKEGITSLGLYAQQMEVAEMQAKKYKDEINYLNKNWKKLGYTEQEYVDKLEELKSAQYDSIQAYHDAKDAIVDLNSERVESIKEGIQKEIDAYSELIEKQKELLDSEKDLYDFQKNIQKQEKDIADIQRQLASLAGDNSASARAQRAKLEAELAEATAALEETYYDRSISKQQEALDKELEHFQEEKDKEIEGWEEYLENTELVVSDSLSMIQANTDVVYQTLKQMGKEYGLSITETLTSPWKEGEYAIQDYTEKFRLTMSATVEELKELMTEFNDIVVQLEKDGATAVNTVNKNTTKYQAATKKPTASGGGNASGSGSSSGNTNGGGSSAAGLVSSISEYIRYGNKGSNVKKLQKALNALGFNCGKVDGIFGDKTLAAVKNFQKSSKYGGAISVDGIVGPNTKKKFKVAGYASGTTEVKKNQLAILDELGEELQLVPDGNGRLAYIQKGTSIIPHDISENLMKLGQLDPSTFLDQNRPSIGMHPEIHNTEISINMDIAEVVHIDRVENDTIPDLTKAIEKQMNAYMSKVNNSLKRYTR